MLRLEFIYCLNYNYAISLHDVQSLQVKNMKPEEAARELGEKNSEFVQKMEELKETVQMLAKPDGSKENPARTCRDIKSNYPEKATGQYWLDPNMGYTSDAILVRSYSIFIGSLIFRFYFFYEG